MGLKITDFFKEEDYKVEFVYNEEYDSYEVILILPNGERRKIGEIFANSFIKIVDVKYGEEMTKELQKPSGHFMRKYRTVGTSKKALEKAFKHFGDKLVWYTVRFVYNQETLVIYKVPFEKILIEPDKVIKENYEIQHHIEIPQEVFDLIEKRLNGEIKKIVIVIRDNNNIKILQ